MKTRSHEQIPASEQNPSNSALPEFVQGGFSLREKSLDVRASGYIYSDSAVAANDGFSLISSEKLLAIYAAMLKCRMIHERARALLQQSHFTLNGHAPVGYEAAAAGVAIDLLPEDTVYAAWGDLVPLFIQGLSLEELFTRLIHEVKSSSAHSAGLKIATDAAMANKNSKNNKIVVAFRGRESTSLSHWRQALETAGGNALPIIFVSLNGSSIEARETNGNNGHARLRAKRSNFPCITVDGNDAVALYRVATEAIAHARKGDGPTLIECQRWTGGDSMLNCDPLRNMERYLAGKGLFREEFKRQVAAGFNQELDAALGSLLKIY